MADRFAIVHADTAVYEGGWSNHPKDRGGATMRGVIQKVYDAYRKRNGLPLRSVRHLTDAEHDEIYKYEYWGPTVEKYNLVPGVDRAVYDAGVNSGVSRAIKWLVAASGSSDHSKTAAKICDIRLRFVMGLRTWKTFGKGWGRRIADVKAKSVRDALAFMASSPKHPNVTKKTIGQELHRSAAEAETKAASASQNAKGAAGGAVTTGGGGGVAVATGTEWDIWIAVGVFAVFAVLVAVLLWQSRMAEYRKAEAEAFRELEAEA